MSLTTALVLVLAAQKKIDVLTKRDRTIVEGAVQKDDFQEVWIKPERTGVQKLKAEDVTTIEFADSPPGYGTALQMIESGRFREALETLNTCEKAIDTMKKEAALPPARKTYPGSPPKDSWWKPYSTYYKALCMRETRDYVGAQANYDAIIKNHKDFRLIREAYIGAMRAAIDRSEPDEAAAGAVLAAAQSEASRLGERMVKELELAQIVVYVRTEKYDQALPLYERLATSSDEKVAVDGVRGVILCKAKKDAGSLPAYCQGLVATSASKRVKMIAAASLGEHLRKKAEATGAVKDYQQAVAMLVDSVVTYYTGRGSGLEDDHQDALFSLAACYDGLAKGAKEANAQRLYGGMAVKTYGEILAAYSSSPRADDASRMMAEAEAKIPPAEKPKEGG